ncbi:3'(2'),5'-bisphosphate nucleotidase CysQ [Gammaproteobacteria bacterium]|nr:3'(2'),5'-bisphosphate nucleotidase CysQ [Gammaproteobacteria bacterium]
MNQKEKLLPEIINLTWLASERIINLYNNKIDFKLKSDCSPLTAADIASHNVIIEGLSKLTPKIPIISEEGSDKIDSTCETYWLVDPLDGTKEFINKNDEFTINIALIENNNPTLGVVCAPALNILYSGIVGKKAFKENNKNEKHEIYVKKCNNKGLIVVGSRSHNNMDEMNAFLKDFKISDFIGVGSSLKFCLIAEGKADIYPRLGRTMEWDIAAGHAVLKAAGGFVTTINGSPMIYGKPNRENSYFIAKNMINLNYR